MSRFADSLVAIATAAAALPRDSATLAALSEDELLALPRLLATITRHVEPSAAAIAGEIARRSSREHGFGGLAQRSGFRTPEHLLQHLTGSTSRGAARLVRAGVIIHESELVAAAEKTGEVLSGVTEPWLAVVGRAGAAALLVNDSATMDADQLLLRARSLRDELDETGIADRERARRTARWSAHGRPC